MAQRTSGSATFEQAVNQATDWGTFPGFARAETPNLKQIASWLEEVRRWSQALE
jgi:hypothetical protein